MKIFLCGQKSFGRAVCKALLEAGHEIVGVAPAPQDKYYDKLHGYANLKNLKVVVGADRLEARYIPGGVDLIVAAHSHWLISDRCLEKARYGGIGFHPSLLPRHKGVDAVRWTIHSGDYITGGTVYKLSDKTDGGDILRQEMLWVDPKWDMHDLWRELFPMGVEMLVGAVSDIESGRAEYKPQCAYASTWEPSWDRPRLERKDLIQIGSVVSEKRSSECGSYPECDDNNFDCRYCERMRGTA